MALSFLTGASTKHDKAIILYPASQLVVLLFNPIACTVDVRIPDNPIAFLEDA